MATCYEIGCSKPRYRSYTRCQEHQQQYALARRARRKAAKQQDLRALRLQIISDAHERALKRREAKQRVLSAVK